MSLKMGSWSCKPESKLFIELLSFPSLTLFYRYRFSSVLRAPFALMLTTRKLGDVTVWQEGLVNPKYSYLSFNFLSSPGIDPVTFETHCHAFAGWATETYRTQSLITI